MFCFNYRYFSDHDSRPTSSSSHAGSSASASVGTSLVKGFEDVQFRGQGTSASTTTPPTTDLSRKRGASLSTDEVVDFSKRPKKLDQSNIGSVSADYPTISGSQPANEVSCFMLYCLLFIVL